MVSKEFQNLDFSPQKIPADYLQAIGLVVVASAQTEDIVQMAIAGILGVDAEIGWALTSHMTSPLRDSVARSLIEFRSHDDAILNEFDSIMGDIKDAWARRAEIVHNLWSIDEKTGEIYSVQSTARAGLIVDKRPMELKEIERDAEFIREAGLRMLKFLAQYDIMPDLPPRNRFRFHMNKAARKKRRKKAQESRET